MKEEEVLDLKKLIDLFNLLFEIDRGKMIESGRSITSNDRRSHLDDLEKNLIRK